MKPFILLILLYSTITSHYSNHDLGPGHFYGAWSMETSESGIPTTFIKIVTPKHFVIGAYNSDNNHFIKASGGTWQLTKEGIEEKLEFDSQNPERIGHNTIYKIDGAHDSPDGKLILTSGKQQQIWHQTDKGNSKLFGTWRITQRKRNGEMRAMPQGSRKTWKVLSGNRFQWAAFNVETKQFLGTGGGTYTAKDGKYTEKIDFFSRDNSRVGMSLTFDFEIKGENWHHGGFSSKGAPIYEIWTNQH